MTEWVRIRLGDREVSINRAYADTLTDVEILDVPAADDNGRPLKESRAGGRRVKPKTTVNTAAAKKAAAEKSAAEIEPSEPGSSTGGVAADQAQEATE